MKKQTTPKSIAEEDIKRELEGKNCSFIAFGTFVNNSAVKSIVREFLKEQKNIKKQAVDLTHAKAIRFKYGENYYLAKQEGECSCIYLFNDDIMGNDAIFIKFGSTPYECKNEFITSIE